jgi:2-amino-4-hydroxy-6-hydroxymethyldihydropteridine diphosphokinase
MNTVFLLLGSNLDDRLDLLKQARNEISSYLGPINMESSIYESEPWGFHAENTFLNQVIRIETTCSPSEILDKIYVIENNLGRKRDESKRYTSRLIDIDILFYNDTIINEKNLVIPHPGIPDRMFTLIPLSEIEDSFIHPGNRKSIREMISECQDTLSVCLYHPA